MKQTKSVTGVSSTRMLFISSNEMSGTLKFFFIFSFISSVISISICDENKLLNVGNTKYLPDWNSLDKRPLPEWYDKAKIGIFIHWGIFSVPSYHSEWFWNYWTNGSDVDEYMKKNYRPGFTYQDFGPMFQAEFFEPMSWAELFERAGAKYVVLTSKHHEGYTLFPSTRSFSWNSVAVGPKRDLVGDLSKAVRSTGLKFGVYHSLYEWYNPIYLQDKKNGFKTYEYARSKLWPDLEQLVKDYQPSVIWSDGDWEANDTYWKSQEFLSWLYNESPIKDEVVVNDRWGIGIPCHHGDFYNCADRYNPGVLQDHKWENAFTLDKKSWGYRRNMNIDEVMTFRQLLTEVVSTISCGGNALINIGPTKEGTIAPVFQERLLSLGKWLKRNGEAIYETSPWVYQQDTVKPNSSIWYTCVKEKYNACKPTEPPKEKAVIAIYAIILEELNSNIVRLRNIADVLVTGKYNVLLLLDDEIPLKWRIASGVAEVTLPENFPPYPVLEIIKK